MRENRTYGSVVGPTQKWVGLPDACSLDGLEAFSIPEPWETLETMNQSGTPIVRDHEISHLSEES